MSRTRTLCWAVSCSALLLASCTRRDASPTGPAPATEKSPHVNTADTPPAPHDAPKSTADDDAHASSDVNPNQALLDEVNSSPNWFRARKTQSIWARRMEADQKVQTLEGLEQVKAGDFLCRGEKGEVWPQAQAKLESRYVATEEVDAEGWRKYVPRPDAPGVMALPMERPFVVETKRGRLSGKEGDYLLKNYQDRDAASPKDLWIVDQQLFRESYQAVTEQK